MPKIEAGASGSFLINGKPYAAGEYEAVYNDPVPTSTTTTITIIPIHKTPRTSIADAPLGDWTDNNDASFATLQAFWTYVQTVFFSAGGGGGGGLSASANGLSDDGTTVELGGAVITKNTILQRTLTGIFEPDITQTLQWNGEDLQFIILNNGTGEVVGFSMSDPDTTPLFFGYVGAGGLNRTGIHLGNQTFLITDESNETGPIGAADYSANALAEGDLAYPQIGAVKKLLFEKSGATQGAAGAAAGEPWMAVGHATLPDGVISIGQ